MGAPLCYALPGLHALTGCDYNPSFYRRGKAKPLKLLKSSAEYQEAFESHGDVNTIDNFDNSHIIEKFICEMRNVRHIQRVNDARFQLFSKNYKPLKGGENFKKSMKNFDASNLPPCRAELYEQYLRSRYITSIWRNAHCKIPSTLKPEEIGWTLQNHKYEFVWFVGEQLPILLDDTVVQPDKSCDDEQESDDEMENYASEEDDGVDSDVDEF